MLRYFIALSVLLLTTVFSQINIEQLRLDDDTSGLWSGHIESELTYKKGNNDLVLLESTVAIEADWTKRSLLLVLKGDIGESNGSRVSNEFVSHLRFIEKNCQTVYYEAFLQYNYNLARKILNREIAGGGARFILHDDSNWKLRLGMGAMYEREEFDVPRESDEWRAVQQLRGSNYLSLVIIPASNMSITTTTYYQPSFKDIQDFRILSETKASFRFSGSLSFTVKFNFIYDNIPLTGLKSYDIDSKYGVTWDF